MKAKFTVYIKSYYTWKKSKEWVSDLGQISMEELRNALSILKFRENNGIWIRTDACDQYTKMVLI